MRSYTYDHANRLTQVVSGTLTTQFSYDGYVPNHIKRANELLSIGNRVQTVVDGQATDYVMDVASPLPQALVATTGGQSSYYLHGADLIGQYDSGTWAYHLPDALGSVRSLTDPAGQVVSNYSFSPFGVPLGESGGDPYGYTGEWWESGAELLYLRARYYNANTGRFISKDPLSGLVTNPQSLNLYAYVLGNPIKYIDPSGHIAWAEAGDALRIIKQLRDDYGVTIVVDFGWRPVPIMHPAPGERLPCADWEEGAWKNVGELNAVLLVAERFENRAGSAEAAQQAIGGATIRRVSEPIRGQHKAGIIKIGDKNFDRPHAGPLEQQWGPMVAIAHELAHYWDWKTGNALSKIFNQPGAIVAGMPGAIQGEPGPTWWAREAGPVEDWVESVAGYLFPEYFAFLAQEGGPREYYRETLPGGSLVTFGPGLRPRHYTYVVAQFRALSVSTP